LSLLVFISRKPMYHPKLCAQSLEKLEKITDLLLVIAIEKFEINKNDVLAKMKDYKVDISSLTLFQRRC